MQLRGRYTYQEILKWEIKKYLVLVGPSIKRLYFILEKYFIQIKKRS